MQGLEETGESKWNRNLLEQGSTENSSSAPKCADLLDGDKAHAHDVTL